VTRAKGVPPLQERGVPPPYSTVYDIIDTSYEDTQEEYLDNEMGRKHSIQEAGDDFYSHRNSAHPTSNLPSSWLTQFRPSSAKGAEIIQTLPQPEYLRPAAGVGGLIRDDCEDENACPVEETSHPLSPPMLEDPTGEFYSSDPNLVKAFNATGLMYEVVRIDSMPDMSFVETEQRLSRRTLLRLSGLRPRDLRRVDPSLSLSTAGPDISTRENMMLINIGDVKAIVTNTSALIFKHQSFTSRRFLRLLQNRMQANFKYAMSDDFEERKLQVPFELVVGEAALISSSSPLEYDLIKSQPRLSKYVRAINRNKLSRETLEGLRTFKQKLISIESRAQAMREMLVDLLDDDEDMRRLALSKPRTTGLRTVDSTAAEEEEREREVLIEEWEMLLEYYLLRYETISSEASRLLEEARDLEETVALLISSRRLELSRIELILSICSIAVGSGAMMSGIFGMNLLSGLEVTRGVFWTVFGLIIVGVIVVGFGVLQYVKRHTGGLWDV